MNAAAPKMLVYIVASDKGLAPNITGEFCTLAVCKPFVRRSAQPGDIVVGMSTARHGKNRLIYAMNVAEKISFADYFNDPRFAIKKPERSGRSGDNFFRYDSLTQTYNLTTAAAAHAGDDIRIARDLRTPFTLVAHDFRYFGGNAPELPADLCATRIVQGNVRGHRVITDRAVIDRFQSWLHAHYAPGIHGRPRDPGLS